MIVWNKREDNKYDAVVGDLLKMGIGVETRNEYEFSTIIILNSSRDALLVTECNGGFSAGKMVAENEARRILNNAIAEISGEVQW